MTVLLWALFGVFAFSLMAKVTYLAEQKYPRETKAKEDAWGIGIDLTLAILILCAILVWQ